MTHFDLNKEIKKREYLDKYNYNMALFSLKNKVFGIGIGVQITLSLAIAKTLNYIANQIITNLSSYPFDSFGNEVFLFNQRAVLHSLALVGGINACLDSPLSRFQTLCLKMGVILTTSMLTYISNIKVHSVFTLGALFISAGLYVNEAQKAMNENRHFYCLRKLEFKLVFLDNAKKFNKS